MFRKIFSDYGDGKGQFEIGNSWGYQAVTKRWKLETGSMRKWGFYKVYIVNTCIIREAVLRHMAANMVEVSSNETHMHGWGIGSITCWFKNMNSTPLIGEVN